MASIQNSNIYLKIANDLKLNLMFFGAHGRAKTAVVNKYAEENDFKLITKILSQFEPTDFLGLPDSKMNDKNEKVTTFSNPDWLVEACDPNKKILLFFDEFNNAEKDVQSSILNLIEDRKHNGMTLADTTQIVMAANPPSIAPNARKLSKATRDRICGIPIFDDNRAYKEYFIKNDMEFISDIIDEIDPVNNYDEDVSKVAYENAEFTYRSLEKAFNIVDYCVKNDIDKKISEEMLIGYGGKVGISVNEELYAKFFEKNKNNNLKKKVESGANKEEIIEYLKTDEVGLMSMNYKDIENIFKYIELNYSAEDFNYILDEITTKEFKHMYYSE